VVEGSLVHLHLGAVYNKNEASVREFGIREGGGVRRKGVVAGGRRGRGRWRDGNWVLNDLGQGRDVTSRAHSGSRLGWGEERLGGAEGGDELPKPGVKGAKMFTPKSSGSRRMGSTAKTRGKKSIKDAAMPIQAGSKEIRGFEEIVGG